MRVPRCPCAAGIQHGRGRRLPGKLRRAYLEEALDYLAEDCETVRNFGCLPGQFCRTGLPALLGGRDILDFVRQAQGELRQTGELAAVALY